MTGGNRGVAAAQLETALVTITYNFTVWQVTEQFGSSGTFAPQIFWDNGYSHPNLQLRWLTIAASVRPSDENKEALSRFEAGRARRPWHKIFRPITNVDDIVKIAEILGHNVTVEVLENRTRYRIVYVPTGETAVLDGFPGKDDDTIRAIAAFAQIELPGPASQNSDGQEGGLH